MKVITTIAHDRTGSTYFQEHIHPIEDVTWNAMEFFNEWNPTHYQRIIREIFFKYNIPFTESYKKYFDKFVNAPHKRASCYNYEMLTDIIKILKKQKYQYFFHKLVPTGWVSFTKDNFLYSNVLNITDKVIVNYRKDILDVFISKSRAIRNNQYVNRAEYNPKYDQEFTWDKEEFMDFSERYINYYDRSLNLINSLNIPYNVVCYEELILSTEKAKAEMIHKAVGHEHPLVQPKVKKQSHAIGQVDAFYNKNQFLSEYETIDEHHKVLKLI